MTRKNFDIAESIGIIAALLTIMAMLFSGFIWMNVKFNSIDNRLTKIETILIVKDIASKDMLGKSVKDN